MAVGRVVSSGGGAGDAEDLAAQVAKLIDTEDWEVRTTACEALGNMGTSALSQSHKVTSLFRDARFAVRSKAVAACGKIGSPSSAADVVEMLEDKAPSVRAQAVRSLPMMTTAYVEKVCERLGDSAPEVRAAALAALPDFGERGNFFAGVVAKSLVDANEVPSVRVAAVEA